MGERVDLSGQTEVTGTSPALRGYVARPASPGPWPGVVMVHEMWGVDDVARRQADRLAEAGYLTVLPDLFSAGGAIRCLKATFGALKAQRGRAFQDIEAARTWLTAQPDCTGRVGVIGFCMGGGFALLAATRGFDASSVNYGLLPDEPDVALGRRLPGGRQLRRQGPRAQGRRGDARVDLDLARRRARRQGVPDGQPLVPQRRPERAARAAPAAEDRGHRPRPGRGSATPGPGSRPSSASTCRPPTDREARGPGPRGQPRAGPYGVARRRPPRSGRAATSGYHGQRSSAHLHGQVRALTAPAGQPVRRK